MIKPWKIVLLTGFLSVGLIGQAQNTKTIQDAKQLMYGEQYRLATNTILGLLHSDEDEAEYNYYTGYIYLHTGNPDSAQFYFDQGVKKDKREPLNYIGQAYEPLSQDNMAAAQGLFDKAKSLSGRSSKAIVYNEIAAALLYADEEKYAAKAMSYLNQAADEKVSSDDADIINARTKMLMGDAYLALENAGKAVGSYEDAIRLNSRLTSKLRTKIGKIYLSARNSTAAFSEFKKAKKANPSYGPIYKELGDFYFTYKSNAVKAQEMYQKYLKLSDISTGSKDRYAAFLYVSKDFEKAIPVIHEVLNTDPDNIIMKRLLGYSLYKTGDYTAASQAFEKYFSSVDSVKMLASDFELYGKTLYETGKDSIGLNYLFEAVERDTSYMKTVENFAQELVTNERYAEAAKMYTRILKQKENPVSQDYYTAGRAFLKAKEYVLADSSFAHVIEFSPDNYIGYYMMAISKFYQDPQGEAGLAKPYYEKVIELTEAEPEKYDGVLKASYGYLATYYTKNENLEKAKTYWEKIEAIDPGNANAKQFFEYYQQVQEYKKERAKALKEKG